MASKSHDYHRKQQKAKHKKLAPLRRRSARDAAVEVSYLATDGTWKTTQSQPGSVGVLIENLSRTGVQSKTISVRSPRRAAIGRGRALVVRPREKRAQDGAVVKGAKPTATPHHGAEIQPERMRTKPSLTFEKTFPALRKGLKSVVSRDIGTDPKSALSVRDRILREIMQKLDETPDEVLESADTGSAEVTVGRLYATKRLANEWGDAIGPFYDQDGLLRWLPELTESDLDDAARRGEVLVVHAGETALYPAFQFDPSGQPLPGLDRVLPILSQGLSSPWDQALWLVGPVDRQTGRTAVDLLRLGHLDAVLGEATADIIGMTA